MGKLKKLFFVLLIGVLSFQKTDAQSDLIFNKRFVECEDKWVAFDKDKDDTFSFGFIYIDATAGLTLNSEGRFIINAKNEFIAQKHDSFSLKIRIENNNVRVAILPESHFGELKIKAVPEWLHYYKNDTLSAARLQRWGYYYNDWGMSEKALEYLEPGYKLDSNFKGMAFELGFAYNALERYEQAIPVITKALELTPKECYLYKELTYAQCNTGKLSDAESSATKGLPNCDDTEMKAEIVYNIAYQYYKLKDKTNFAIWAEKTKKWAAKGGLIYKTIISLEEKMK